MVDISCLDKKKKNTQRGQAADLTDIRSPIWKDQASLDRGIDWMTLLILYLQTIKYFQVLLLRLTIKLNICHLFMHG